MPLPLPNSTWPPPAVVSAYKAYEENDVWFAGDKQRIAEFYRGKAENERDRPSLSSRMWAQARRLDERERRMHLPLAGDIAGTSADLLFSEPPSLTVEQPETQERLNEIIEQGGVDMRLLEAAEVCAGIGDVYLKLAWDVEQVGPRPIIAVEHGDAAIPTWRWGRLQEVTFWREVVRDGNTVWRLLEHHEPGAIIYGLFEGDPGKLGQRRDLTALPETAGLAEVADADGVQATGIAPLLTATHIPNMRPNRALRGTAFGRSDYAAPIYDLFDSLDLTWTSWIRDLRLGRARLIVPKGYLQPVGGPGEGATWDADREVWAELDMDPSAQGGGITLSQFAIRVAEHQVTAESAVVQAVRSAGYSAQTFGLAGDVGATATEVNARERRTMTTRDRKGRYWSPALSRIFEAALALDRAMGWSAVEPEQPTVEFPPAVSQDPESMGRTLQLLEAAAAVSTDTKVRMLHPDWENPAVEEEVARIHGDRPAPPALPGLDDLGLGGAPNDPPPDPAE
ncbi:MAG: hypothetical protein ACRDT8_00185 [Micromonosporaceae bacterium]